MTNTFNTQVAKQMDSIESKLNKAFESCNHDVFNRLYKFTKIRVHESIDSFVRDLYTCKRMGLLTDEEIESVKADLYDFERNAIRIHCDTYAMEIGEEEYSIRWVMDCTPCDREQAIAEVKEWGL